MTVEHPLDGTPAARFTQLLSELDKRFPDKRPFSAEPVEGRYLGAIDRLIAKTSDRLVHQVKLDDWAHVVRVMKEYKKKIHARYYLHVSELKEGYRVKVFKRAAD